MLYDLCLNHNCGNANVDLFEIKNNEQWLLKEILGYTEDEIDHIVNVRDSLDYNTLCQYHYTNKIAINLTDEQVCKIAIPFDMHGSHIWCQEANEEGAPVALYNVENYKHLEEKATIKSHYYDKPVTTREQLPNVFEKILCVPIKAFERNIPKCPTCNSQNIQKISGLERCTSIIGLGIFSKKINKSFKCNNCGYMW